MALQGHQRQRIDHAKVLPALARFLPLAHGRDNGNQPKHNDASQTHWQPCAQPQINGDARVAKNMYRGVFEFAGEAVHTSVEWSFAAGVGSPAWTTALNSLDWLSHFAIEPKKLMACFAVNLLWVWYNGACRLGDVDSEANRLSNMQNCFPILAGLVEPSQQRILLEVWQCQIDRLKKSRPRNMNEAVNQSIALARAALATAHPGDGLATSLRLLDIALPKAIRVDGSPALGSAAELLVMLHEIRQLENQMGEHGMGLTPICRGACDKMLAFVSMFQRCDGSLAFELRNSHFEGLTLAAPGDIQSEAQHGQVYRVCWGGSVLIASGRSGVDISTAKFPLMSFGPLTSSGGSTAVVAENDPSGSLLQFHKRQIYMASSGQDIRVQEELSSNDATAPLKIMLNPAIRILLARQGTQASLALPDRTHWQLSLRGGYFEMGAMDGELVLRVDPTAGKLLNWAIKRMPHVNVSSNPKPTKKPQPATLLLL